MYSDCVLLDLIQAEGGSASQLNILVRDGRYGRDEPSLSLCHSIDTTIMQVNVRKNKVEERTQLSMLYEQYLYGQYFVVFVSEFNCEIYFPIPQCEVRVHYPFPAAVHDFGTSSSRPSLRANTKIICTFHSSQSLVPTPWLLPLIIIPNLSHSLSRRNHLPHTWPVGVSSWMCGMAMR